MERVRLIAAGARTLGSLTADERLLLAQALVERGAPELAERVAPHTSGALSGGELTGLTRALLSVERGQLEALSASLRDPDERRRLLVAASGGIEELLDRGEGEVATPSLAEPDAVPAPPHDRPPSSEPVPLPPPPQAPPAEQPRNAESAASQPPAPQLPPLQTGTHRGPTADPVPASALPQGSETLVDPVPRTPVGAVDVPDVVASIERATTARGRLAAVATAECTTLTADEGLAILRAVPDGWQRRTAARRLIAAGGVADVDADAWIASFARSSDRIAVAGALVDAGLARTETVTAHLDDRAAGRLQRRAARDA